ncbi:helix-turn-helix domain-containing protein [Stenotrophomonas rhizophila]|uniref:helix-turn-helix domain-containing protein n=1 Tax=Stenotrophomonas rhizophila TaxID=216778 RepID=UPI001E45693E|nr:helix-turn-helix domain-containing protein [Stenotrophomonas rhizophila]MCC7633916.1 helix-turn-helix domain-containing protein [Stenotrophomonas rhizophila]MCC7663250.1 helix-turn-helix domain-containing protein [Stenotrophomonas rhizophila]
MRELDIAEVVRRSGVAASALRYYEQLGLIAPIGRHGLRRVFADSVLERLALIALGRAAGLSLQEVGVMLAGEGAADLDRARLAAQADALDRSIARMTAMRDGLRHAAACRAASHLQCSRFRALMRLATRAGPD